VNNEGAIDFYKKFGFEVVETKQQYYKRIEPADAHVLQKTLEKRTNSNNMNHTNNSNSQSNSQNQQQQQQQPQVNGIDKVHPKDSNHHQQQHGKSKA
jgi:hypothetical protein